MSAPASIADRRGRPLRNLRLSVTDRCNLRCAYCMPEEEYVWLPREDILTFEEAAHLVDVFADLGVDKVRLTGGEPLLAQRDWSGWWASSPRTRALRDLAITTNGILLAERAAALRAAGLHRVTVSLDTLRPDRFRALTRREALPQVLEGIAAVGRAGFPGLKLDTVVMRGTNDDEIPALIEYARGAGAEIRFIEYMDVGGATHWSMDRVVSRAEMLAAPRAALRPDRADSARRARRPPTASVSPTGTCSASSRPPRRPSARRATGAGSPPTASGISASTPRRARTCARRCGRGRRGRSSAP